MPSQIDFAIAAGIFIVFLVILISYLLNYLGNYSSVLTSSELRTTAYNIFNILFGTKGVPENWEEKNYTPVQVGLVTDLIKVPIVVKEIYEKNFTNFLVSVENLKLDTHLWNSTVRVYDEDGNEVKYDFDEIYYDSFGFVKELSISFLTNLTAYQEKKFYIYGSRDKAIVFKNYTLNEWWNSSYEYRKPIVLVEMLGQARNNELTSKHIIFDKNCEHKIINSSLRVVDDNGQSISFFISNATYCAENQLKEADIWFNVSISANTHTVYWVYFNTLK